MSQAHACSNLICTQLKFEEKVWLAYNHHKKLGTALLAQAIRDLIDFSNWYKQSVDKSHSEQDIIWVYLCEAATSENPNISLWSRQKAVQRLKAY